MFTRAEKEVLKSLSGVVYGATSKWQKFYENGSFNIKEPKEVSSEGGYVALRNSKKGGPGTIVKLETAQKMGYKLDAVEPEYTTRRPTYEEMVNYLEKQLHLSILYAAKKPNKDIASSVDAEERSRFLSAWLLARDGVPMTPLILTGPQESTEYMESLTGLISNLPESLQGKVNELKENMNDTTLRAGLSFDALLFLGDLIICTIHKDEADSIYRSVTGVTHGR